MRGGCGSPTPAAQPAESVTRLLDEAEAITPLETAIIARDGQILAERGYRGHATTAVTNIKSASKSVISALARPFDDGDTLIKKSI
ncbi:hypothetical protein [Brenneria tiliae]|uniref:Beta-lactamase-related domain-containing protein n=1 Tax=Brenneria tiliae TaxID=2914984 RepID=A0ABT0MXM3_9GAMM|nr:hypothetical protein [Brenneria tiliae]MCL2894580.1 hypothetical protein [Brenneria tiliae]